MPKFSPEERAAMVAPPDTVRSADYIWNNWKSLFPKKFKPIAREFKVSASLVSGDTGAWLVDFLAEHNSKRYIVECDVNKSAHSVWHGFKVFGYRAAYCIDNAKRPSEVGMMIFMPNRLYNNRTRNMMAVAGVEFCTFDDTDGGYRVSKASLWSPE